MHHDPTELKTYPPKVVGSVTTLEDWNSLCKSDISDQCDWIEMRLDTFPQHITAQELMVKKPYLPILATARCVAEGGKRAMDESVRLDSLRELLPYAHAIDIEIASMDGATNLIDEARNSGTLVVASGHDFEKTPDVAYLRELEQKARDKGADIVKLAFMLSDPKDIVTGIQMLEKRTGPMSIMGMGALGQTSRLLYAQLGSCLIYGFLGHYAAAPGQWPAKAFKSTLALLHPFGETAAQ